MSRERRLRVDWGACEGHGLCAQWAPEVLSLDEWGFPLVREGPVPTSALAHVRAAVDACPVLALRLLPTGPG